MNELDLLDFFYDELRETGKTRDQVFISLDDSAIAKLQIKLNSEIQPAELYKCADICFANEWIERTTVDPGYNYLSLTEAGLSVAIGNRYQSP